MPCEYSDGFHLYVPPFMRELDFNGGSLSFEGRRVKEFSAQLFFFARTICG